MYCQNHTNCHLVETFHLPAHLCGPLDQNVDVTVDYRHYLTRTSLKYNKDKTITVSIFIIYSQPRCTKNTMPHEKCWCGAYFPYLGLDPIGNAWTVRCQTYRYLPSQRTSLHCNWNQIILLGDRGICVWTTCPTLQSSSGTVGTEMCAWHTTT